MERQTRDAEMFDEEDTDCNLCSADCSQRVDNCFSKTFYKLGGMVYRWKYIFLVFPITVFMFLSIGLLKLVINDDVEYLFTPENVRSLDEKVRMQSYFLVGDEGTEFVPDRILSTYLKHGEIIAVAKDGGNIMTEDALREILFLDEKIRTTNYSYENGTTINFEKTCMKWFDQCIDNPVVMIYRDSLDHFDQVTVTYPSVILDNGRELFVAPQILGVEFDTNLNKSENPKKVVTTAAGFYLVYFLSTGSKTNDDAALFWEMRTEELVRDINARTEYVDLYYAFSYSLKQEIQKASSRVVPRFAATFCMMIVFAVLSLMTSDWVVSRPILGILGVLSAGFAIVSAVGTLGFLEVEFNEVVAMMPFLVIGVGVDDMFIMVAAWRQIGLHVPVEKRMSKTYSEAAVSITITNVTDVFAFLVGATTPIPAVRMFCIYAGVAMIYAYLYQITFFGACMSFSGEREAQNRHCLTFQKVLPKEKAENSLYRIFCAGGISSDSKKTEAQVKHPFVTFFRSYYGPMLRHIPVKIGTTILFVICIFGTVIGCMDIKEGLRLQNLAPDDSAPWSYYKLRDEYLPAFSPPVSILIEGRMDYSSKVTQDRIEALTARLEESEYAYGPEYTTSWLRAFLWYLQYRTVVLQSHSLKLDNIHLQQFRDIDQIAHVNASLFFEGNKNRIHIEEDPTINNNYRDFSGHVNSSSSLSTNDHVHFSGDFDLEASQKNIMNSEGKLFITDENGIKIALFDDIDTKNLNEATFIKILKDEFLSHPRFAAFKLDIIFEIDKNNETYIQASRLIVPTYGAKDAIGEKDLMLDYRTRAEDDHLNITVYSPWFLVYDQYVGIVSYTMHALSIAIVCMLLVSLIMIPHPLCAIFVTLCAVSIDCAVLGYMSLWDVSLDIVSVINIILCIGFSVDFSAHITYAFVTAKHADPTERSIQALGALGTPILQSALSSIIALSPLSTASVYIFRIFFKTLFLVMVFGALHGLLFLPVMLSFVGRCIPPKEGRNVAKSPKVIVAGGFRLETAKFQFSQEQEVLESLITVV